MGIRKGIPIHMGGISQLPKCPPRQLPGSISLVQQDRSLPRGISLARDPGILALVPEPFSAQSRAPAQAGMGWGDENGSLSSVLSDSGVSQTGTSLLKQSFGLFIPQFPAPFPGMPPGCVGNRMKGTNFWRPGGSLHTRGVTAEQPELPQTHPA